jgi:hypothetical protein
MKRYVWMAALLAATGASASENPFELKENFQKIEQEQDTLLKGLKVIAQKQEALEEEADDADIDADIDAEDETSSDTEQNSASAGDEQGEEETIKANKPVPSPVITEEKVVAGKKPSSETKAVPEVVKIDKIKAEQTAANKAKAEAEAKAHKEAMKQAVAAKAEQERIAKEKAEAEKKAAQEAELARLQAEKARLESEAKEKAQAGKKKEVVSGVDINITKEELEAKRKADAALLEAIKEVDQED